MSPNFLFIGPDKTGSSWLFEVLSRLDDVFVAPAKDLYYFDRYYHLGEKWYSDQFRDWSGERAVGEISHDYLFSPLAASRIANDLPRARLLVSLRDPVARTFSHYLYLRRSGLVNAPLLESLEKWPELVNNSLYGKHLLAYYKYFPQDQIHIGWFEEMSERPLAYLNKINRFLALPEVSEVPVKGVVRAASYARSPTMAKLVKAGARTARSLGMARAVSSFKHSRLISGALYKEYGASDRPSIRPEEVAVLRRLFFKDIECVEGITGLDLTQWKE